MDNHDRSRRRLNKALFSIPLWPLIASCGQKKTSDLPVINLRQEWIPYSGFTGEVLASTLFAAKNGIKINVRAGSETIDPIKNVLAKQDDIGVASGDLIISAISSGAPLVAIATINNISPTCFISRSKLNIQSPADFTGKTVGILAGTNTERIYKLLMKRNHVDRAKVTEVDIPPEVDTFILGKYDVRPGFVYDEPVTLKQAHVDVKVLHPSDFGVRVIGTVYFTRKDVIANRRAAVIRVLQSLIQGWQEVQTPEGITRGVDALKRAFPEINVERETESLKLGASLFAGPQGANRPLTGDDENWNNTIAALEELGEIKPGSISLDGIYDRSLLNEAYNLMQS